MKNLSFSLFNVVSVGLIVLLIVLILVPFNIGDVEQAQRIAKWINVYACNSALTAPADGARYDTNYNAVSAAKGELIGTGYFDGIITDYPLVAIDSEYIKNKIANDDTNVTFIIEAAQEGEGHYIYSANSGSEYEIRLFID